MTIRRNDERLYEFAAQLESYAERIAIWTAGHEQLTAQLHQYAADARTLGDHDATEDDIQALRDRFAATVADVSDRDTARTLEVHAGSLNPYLMALTDPGSFERSTELL